MPANPLLPSFAQIRSRALRAGIIPATDTPLDPPVDQEGRNIPDDMDPIAEGRGPFLPYRGTEMHGVPAPPPGREDAEGYTGGTVNVHYREDDDGKPEHVLPVRIVEGESSAVTFTAFRVDQFIVPSDRVIMIVPRLRTRKKLIIRNMNQGGNRVWIGPTAEIASSGIAGGAVHATGAFPVMGNSREDFTTTEAMYAIAAGPNLDGSAQVVMYWEFEVEE